MSRARKLWAFKLEVRGMHVSYDRSTYLVGASSMKDAEAHCLRRYKREHRGSLGRVWKIRRLGLMERAR